MLEEEDVVDVQLAHINNQKKLKSAWEDIFERYGVETISDEIDLRTNKVIVDNGHLRDLPRIEFAMPNTTDEYDEADGSYFTDSDDGVAWASDLELTWLRTPSSDALFDDTWYRPSVLNRSGNNTETIATLSARISIFDLYLSPHSYRHSYAIQERLQQGAFPSRDSQHSNISGNSLSGTLNGGPTNS
ncbi:hypothetical protein BZG36_04164 [Bifiguratus adelaidae]|uniref:Uncharacterized protein n=1 Tax=Bifiguratus adelaidae TaxID=1938954 RepID=A0A261XWD9_9FUNG|nr:hypothetical protein BZG36_04164 [Bifiguratus adelaidae]